MRDSDSQTDGVQWRVAILVIWGQRRLCARNRGTNDSPAWPCKSTGSSGRSGGRGAEGPSGASSERGTAVSRRSSGMWLGSGGRHAQRDLLCFTIMQQAQRTGTEYIISCPSFSPLCRATERTLVRPVTHSLKTAFPKSKTSIPDILHFVTGVLFKLMTMKPENKNTFIHMDALLRTIYLIVFLLNILYGHMKQIDHFGSM